MMFTIPFNSDPIMKIEVWDNDAVNDDLIGAGMQNIAQYLGQRMNTTRKNSLIQFWSICIIKTDLLEELTSVFSSVQWEEE